jgi:hypothetical protein
MAIVMSSRRIALLLVMLVGASHALLDSCLLGCGSHLHTQLRQESGGEPSAHCHDEAGSADDGIRLRSASFCDHDHAGMTADVTPHLRAGTAPRVLALAVVTARESGSSGLFARVELLRTVDRHRRYAASHTPLRV